MNIQGQFILTEHDKQLHFGAGMITSALGYTWSYNKHQNKKRAKLYRPNNIKTINAYNNGEKNKAF